MSSWQTALSGSHTVAWKHAAAIQYFSGWADSRRGLLYRNVKTFTKWHIVICAACICCQIGCRPACPAGWIVSKMLLIYCMYPWGKVNPRESLWNRTDVGDVWVPLVSVNLKLQTNHICLTIFNCLEGVRFPLFVFNPSRAGLNWCKAPSSAEIILESCVNVGASVFF